jgi:hypothetical protein
MAISLSLTIKTNTQLIAGDKMKSVKSETITSKCGGKAAIFMRMTTGE